MGLPSTCRLIGSCIWVYRCNSILVNADLRSCVYGRAVRTDCMWCAELCSSYRAAWLNGCRSNRLAYISISFLLRHFLLLRLFLFCGRCIEFSVARSPVLCFFYLYSFLPLLLSYNTTPPQFGSSYISVSTDFRLPCSHKLHFLQYFYPGGLTITASRL